MDADDLRQKWNEGYTRSDGWDSPETKLKGHGSGHYMSALALAYAAAVSYTHLDVYKRQALYRIERTSVLVGF